MEDDNKDQQVITKQETVEIVDQPGLSSGSTAGALNSIFDKIEAGKAEGISAKDSIKEDAPEKNDIKPEPKKEDLNKIAEEPAKKLNEEFSRDSLRNGKQDAKPEEPKAEAAQDQDVPDDELKVLPHDKPKTAKRIQALLKRIDGVSSEAAKTKAEVLEKAAKLTELEKKLAEVQSSDPATNEKVKAQLDELSMFRRRYELDNDPEIKTKFDKRVEQAETSINEVLIKRNAGKALLDIIKEEGGWNKFSNSTRQIPISDGEGGVMYSPGAEIADQILQALPLGERKAIESAMLEQVQTNREKDRFLKEEQEKANKYFAERENISKKQAEENEKQMQEARKSIDAYVEKQMKEEWIADKQIPDGATAQEKAAILEHNKYNAQLRGVLKKAVATKDLNGLLEIITDSVRYFDERRKTDNLSKENATLKAELKAKQAEIDKVKGAGRSVPRTGSISSPMSQERDSSKAPQTLEETLERMERGERFSKDHQILVGGDE
jgi:hypothetical protein